MRTDDPLSKSPILARNRSIFAYYHITSRLGTAQVHMVNIFHRVTKATDVEPHELIMRLKAAGGELDVLREILADASEAMKASGKAARFRAFKNQDGTIDGEVRIDTDGDFLDTLLVLGDEVILPNGV